MSILKDQKYRINRDGDHVGTLFLSSFREKRPYIRGIANIKRIILEMWAYLFVIYSIP